MTTDGRARAWDLWSRFVLGAPLDRDEEAQLGRALAGDPELRRAALEDDSIHGVLRELARPETTLDALAARLGPLVAAERDAEAFASRVGRRLTVEKEARRRRGWWMAALAGTLASAAAGVLLIARPPRVVAPAPGLFATTRPPAPAAPPPELPGAVTPAPATATLPAAPTGPIVYRYEDRRPAKVIGREVNRCPPRAASASGAGTRCLVGVVFSERLRSLSVRLGERSGLFTHDGHQTLVFDYWMGAWTGPQSSRLELTLRVMGRGDVDYKLAITNPTPTRWQTVVVPLSELRASKGSAPEQHLRPGDRVTLMKFVTSSTTQDVLYIDNLRVIGAR